MVHVYKHAYVCIYVQVHNYSVQYILTQSAPSACTSHYSTWSTLILLECTKSPFPKKRQIFYNINFFSLSYLRSVCIWQGWRIYLITTECNLRYVLTCINIQSLFSNNFHVFYFQLIYFQQQTKENISSLNSNLSNTKVTLQQVQDQVSFSYQNLTSIMASQNSIVQEQLLNISKMEGPQVCHVELMLDQGK